MIVNRKSKALKVVHKHKNLKDYPKNAIYKQIFKDNQNPVTFPISLNTEVRWSIEQSYHCLGPKRRTPRTTPHHHSSSPLCLVAIPPPPPYHPCSHYRCNLQKRWIGKTNRSDHWHNLTKSVDKLYLLDRHWLEFF